MFNHQLGYTAAPAAAAAASAEAPDRTSSGGDRDVSRLPDVAGHAAVCGGRKLATRNELRPFAGPDSYALLYLL